MSSTATHFNSTQEAEELALNGAAPAVTIENPPLVRWGEAEKEQLCEMLEQNSLFYWNGPKTKLLIERFQKFYPLEYVMPCSSGTAALHIAVAAAGIGPGDEVITSAITDMGSVIGILYQQGVPVFAELEAHRYTLDPVDVRKKITPKTKAVIAVHLAGNPGALTELKEICDEHNLILIEDCAQSWGAMHGDKPVGTIGHIGCWSLNDFKHIGCGDGGVVASSDERFGPILQKFGDKSYSRTGGARRPDTLAPNYRISEPQSAVAAAQMERMWDITGKRAALGARLNELLADVPGVHLHAVDPQDRCTFWFYLLRVDTGVLQCSAGEFTAALNAEGVPAGAGYIGEPLYKYPLFADENFFAGRWPVKELGLTDMDYNAVHLPETEAILQTCIQIPIKENMSLEWIEQAAAAIAKVARHHS
jgi:dTDP-4-amino-4,6-dideoxygalactose transaminase